MELVYADTTGKRQGVLRAFSLDMECGDGDNDYVVTVPLKTVLPLNGYVYAVGTDIGGLIDAETVDATGDYPVRKYSGRTWSGVLRQKVVVPSSAYYTMKGEANAAIQSLMDYINVPFRAEVVDSGFTLNYQVNRFENAYTALRKALASVGAKLQIKREDNITTLSAVSIDTIRNDGRGSYSYKSTNNSRPVNHMVCAGEGELENRTVVHLYADKDGNVSQTQTLTGLDEVTQLYDFNNADKDELIKRGTEKLNDYQKERKQTSLSLPDTIHAGIGDIVKFRDYETNFSQQATIGTVVVTVESDGITTYSYKAEDNGNE